MQKIDPTVARETKYILYVSLVLSLLMEAVFLIIGKWDTKVLFGNLLGLFTEVMNFFLMALTVQKAVGKEQKDAAVMLRGSQSLRLVGIFAIGAVAAVLPVFNIWAFIITLFFERLAIMLRPLVIKENNEEKVREDENEE